MRPHPPRARPGSAPTALDRAPLASTSLASLAEQSPPSLRRLPVILQRLADIALGVLADHHHPPLRKPARLNHLSGGPDPRLGGRFGPLDLTRFSRLAVGFAERGRRRSRKRVGSRSYLGS